MVDNMAPQNFNFDEIDEFFEYRRGYPRPDWDRIHDWVERLPVESDLHFVWTEIAAKWLGMVADHLQDNYSLWESEHFFIVCNRTKPDSEKLTRYCEKARKRIIELLGRVTLDEGLGKIIVLIFSEVDDYYDYVADWYPDEGEFGASAGMFVTGYYPHILVHAGPSLQCHATIVHELNHFLLKHLPLPLWLNEGITQIVEEEIAGSPKGDPDDEILRKHARWWTPDTIQEFWEGSSFSAPDDRQQLSYDLAQRIVARLLNKFPSTFATFLQSANHDDAGDIALWTTCRYSLSQAVSDLLGNQDWNPKPFSQGNSQSGPSAEPN